MAVVPSPPCVVVVPTTNLGVVDDWPLGFDGSNDNFDIGFAILGYF